MSASDAFLWGASTAPHQIEGNNINADWWEIEHTPGVPFPDRSADATDSFHRYGEDMRLPGPTENRKVTGSTPFGATSKTPGPPGVFSRPTPIAAVTLDQHRDADDRAMRSACLS